MEEKANQIYNCKGSKVNGKCIFDRQCLIKNAIYCVSWLPTLKAYIRKTMGQSKGRVNTHITDLAKCWKKSELERKKAISAYPTHNNVTQPPQVKKLSTRKHPRLK